MTSQPVGKVFDIQGFSIQDGPGIRTTVFLKGCPLRCPWCHSPESILFQPQLSWIAMRCIGVEKCGNCIDACAKRGISPGETVKHAVTQENIQHVLVNRELCDACGSCAAICYPKALSICGVDYTVDELVERVCKDIPFYENSGGGVTISGGEPLCQPDFTLQVLIRLKERGIHTAIDTTGCVICYPKALSICGVDYTVDELVERVCKDIPFYENSGGGVTISGGEPLCQPDFTLQVLIRLKERGIHTAIDTTGCVPYDILERVLPYTDLFLYDLKHMDGEVHKATVGVGNELILENARRLAGEGGKMQIRIPVIPRFNDSPEVIEAAGEFCKSLGDAVVMIQLLPYHNLGVVKHQRIGGAEKVLEAAPPSDEKIAELKRILDEMGLPVTVH